MESSILDILKEYTTDNQLDKFKDYYKLLIEWNANINLTTITEINEVFEKHFLDSILLLKYANLNNKSIIDVGTGAGFPGLPLSICEPNAKFVLLDSLNKRVTFLNTVIKELALTNIETYHGRAEDFARDINFREKYDYVVSRAVAPLPTLLELCTPYLKINGIFVAYKSIKMDEELGESEKALQELNCEYRNVKEYELPVSNSKRNLVFIKKTHETPNKYPRQAGKPKKNPL